MMMQVDSKKLNAIYLFGYNIIQFTCWLYIASQWEKHIRLEIIDVFSSTKGDAVDSLSLYANIKYVLYFSNGVGWLEFVHSLKGISRSKPVGVFNQQFARFVCTYFIMPYCDEFLAGYGFKVMILCWFLVDLFKYL